MSRRNKRGILNGIHNYFEIMVPVEVLLFPDLGSMVNDLPENIRVDLFSFPFITYIDIL
jgi:hypothetical protein